MTSVLDVDDLVQEYPGVRALKGVSLSLDQGEVLGLVGENGAGKSTLIRILGGIETPVEGEVRLRGVVQHFRSSSDSQAAGISVVSQEFRLVPELSVADNIFLGHERTVAGVVRARRTRALAREVIDRLGMDLDPDRSVGSLTVGDRQMVEIARALSRDFDILVMDEPTAALNGAEIERLRGIVAAIAGEGKSVIYVSHHLEEIFSFCSQVAVLRDGALVHAGPTVALDESMLVEHMLGRMPEVFSRHEGTTQSVLETPRLRVTDVALPGFSETFSLSVAPGEVVGLAGLVGSGRDDLTRGLFGDRRILSGTVEVDGEVVRLRDPIAAIAAGVFMLSEDRKSEGILPHLDVTENAMMSRTSRGRGFFERLVPARAREAMLFQGLRRTMSIRVPDGRQLIGNLSGGNQQKVLLGRAVLSGCRVLLLNEPTRGVDVGAKVEIYQLIRELADDGVAVVVSSSDAPELAMIADRCVVYFAGRQVAELRDANINEDAIVSAAVGQVGA